ncbi:MAG: hypothetical protein ABIM43_00345 [candidate division WOR-3 bacterium]
MYIEAEIEGIRYTTYFIKSLEEYELSSLEKAFQQKSASFILKIDELNKLALSYWVSPKRTRSYPYARVYDTLSFTGRKATIIPVIKDEGQCGDRDFLQWDTISLMSLLGVFVIIAYYADAEINVKNKKKITNQSFDLTYIKNKILELTSYKSDALHWNLEQVDNIREVAERALEKYREISEKLGVPMHSFNTAEKRIEKLKKGKEQFMQFSRDLAQKAQHREKNTIQPKELLNGTKTAITIKNYLGGIYYFTCDEVKIINSDLYLIEAKHTKKRILPSDEDIKDGLLKMLLYTNLKNIKIGEKVFNPKPVLKLTTTKSFKIENIPQKEREIIEKLKKEAKCNRFLLQINSEFIQ